MLGVAKAVETYARLSPDRLAILDEASSSTYSQLYERANRWANALKDHSLAPGETALLLMVNRVAYLEALIGLVLADALIVPINVQITGKDIVHLFALTGAKVLITEQRLVDEMESELRSVGGINIIYLEQLDLNHYPDTFCIKPSVQPNMLFFTSGTSGKPKGIVVPKRLFNLSQPFKQEKPMKQLLCRPLFFRAHLTAACNILQEGNTVVLISTPDPSRTLDLVRLHNIPFISMGPSDLLGLMSWLERQDTGIPASVRHIMITGATPSQMLKQQLLCKMPNVQFTDVYGTSELGAITLMDGREWMIRVGSCGRNTFFTEVIILGEDGEKLDPWQQGEVCVKSRFMMSGYYMEPELTRASMCGPFMKTGDIGYLDEDGYLYLKGRSHDAINRAGFHFYPLEVEYAIEQHSRVEQAVVIGFEHPEQNQVPIAFVKCKGSLPEQGIAEEMAVRELLAFTADRVARFKVPEDLVFVPEIPLNSAGKTDRIKLALYYAAAEMHNTL